jgi:pimeloyl-ACP methyl ester carboxylesterase
MSGWAPPSLTETVMDQPVDLDDVDDQLVPTLDIKPTLVFVHGAFSDGASWSSAVEHLGDHCPYRIFANPLRGVSADGAALAALLQSIDGPIILVGHSYGGALLTQAGCATTAVKALVFVAGLAPDEGESFGELVARFPGSDLSGALAPTRRPDGGAELYVPEAHYGPVLAGDLSHLDVLALARRQRPAHPAVLSDPVGAPAWRTLPCWFIYGDADRSLPPALHQFMAHRTGAAGVEVIAGGSHSLHVSHSHRVMKFIERAAMAAEYPVPNLDP